MTKGDVFTIISAIVIVFLLGFAFYKTIEQYDANDRGCDVHDGHVRLLVRSGFAKYACYDLVDGQYIFYAIKETE